MLADFRIGQNIILILDILSKYVYCCITDELEEFKRIRWYLPSGILYKNYSSRIQGIRSSILLDWKFSSLSICKRKVTKAPVVAYVTTVFHIIIIIIIIIVF